MCGTGCENVISWQCPSICFAIVLEPGYYENGAFGIRIENILVLKDVTLEVKKMNQWNLTIFNTKIIDFLSLFRTEQF